MEKMIIYEASKRFGGEPSTLKLLGGFFQNVFEMDYQGEKAVLKIVPDDMDKESLLIAEFDYMSYLRGNGIKTVQLLPSRQNKQIEKIHFNGKTYLAMVFEKAVGKFINVQDPDEWNDHLFQRWGANMGKMHRLSKNYSCEHLLIKRYQWNEEPIFNEPPSNLDSLVLNKWNECMGVLKTYPKDKDSYGLIHYDFHQKNFLIDAVDEMTIIDFGDCQYSWFIYDVVIALYHSMDHVKPQERDFFLPRFMEHFLKGYLSENTLNEDWISKIPSFLKFRRIYSYIYINNYIDLSNISTSQQNFLSEMKSSIIEDRDFIKELHL